MVKSLSSITKALSKSAFSFLLSNIICIVIEIDELQITNSNIGIAVVNPTDNNKTHLTTENKAHSFSMSLGYYFCLNTIRKRE